MTRGTMACWVVVLLGAGVLTAQAQVPPLINYQGKVINGTNLVNGSVELSIRIYTNATAGSFVLEDTGTVAVVDGLYSTWLGDGLASGAWSNVLAQGEAWIEVVVNSQIMSPRERLGSVAFALMAGGVTNEAITGDMIASESIDSEKIKTGGILLANLHDGSVNNSKLMDGSVTSNKIDWSTMPRTTNFVQKIGDTMSGSLTNEQTVTARQFFNSQNDVGSTNNIALGGSSNIIDSTARYCAIGGGHQNAIWLNADYSVIGGGQLNIIGTNTDYGVIGGGYQNIMQVGTYECVIGGGSMNTIERSAQRSTIGGGIQNAIGTNAVCSTIPGGHSCRVSTNADYALAAGRRAQARHSGSFVWADSQDADFASWTSNEVAFRCEGGVRFDSGVIALNQVVRWVPGDGSWSFSSDRNLKENFVPVDAAVALEKVAALPLMEWNYKGYSQRHVGPMAQDFHAAFPLNDSDTTLNSADIDGVALAAIQGLKKENDQLKARLAEVEKKLKDLVRNGSK